VAQGLLVQAGQQVMTGQMVLKDKKVKWVAQGQQDQQVVMVLTGLKDKKVK